MKNRNIFAARKGTTARGTLPRRGPNRHRVAFNPANGRLRGRGKNGERYTRNTAAH